jgi:hypothetical protein
LLVLQPVLLQRLLLQLQISILLPRYVVEIFDITTKVCKIRHHAVKSTYLLISTYIPEIRSNVCENLTQYSKGLFCPSSRACFYFDIFVQFLLFPTLSTCLSTPFALVQGCQMVYFQIKITNLGIFWKGLGWKILVYFMAIWYFYAILVCLRAIWYVCGHLDIFSQFWFFASRKFWQPRCRLQHILIR